MIQPMLLALLQPAADAAGNVLDQVRNPTTVDLVLSTVSALGIPTIIWYVRRLFGQSRLDRFGRIVAVADQAVTLAEELNRTDRLPLSEDRKTRLTKAQAATRFLIEELKKSGINVDVEQAREYIDATYGAKIGGVRPLKAIEEAANAAADELERLQARTDLDLPAHVDRAAQLMGLASHALQVTLVKQGIDISLDDAASWLKAAVYRRLQDDDADVPAGERLTQLARRAFEFVDDLRSSGGFVLTSDGAQAETDLRVAAAWLLAEVSRRGLPVALDEVEDAIVTAASGRPMPSAATA